MPSRIPRPASNRLTLIRGIINPDRYTLSGLSAVDLSVLEAALRLAALAEGSGPLRSAGMEAVILALKSRLRAARCEAGLAQSVGE